MHGLAALLMFTVSKIFVTTAVDTSSVLSFGGGVDFTTDFGNTHARGSVPSFVTGDILKSVGLAY